MHKLCVFQCVLNQNAQEKKKKHQLTLRDDLNECGAIATIPGDQTFDDGFPPFRLLTGHDDVDDDAGKGAQCQQTCALTQPQH